MKIKSEFLGSVSVHKLMLSLGVFAVVGMIGTGSQVILTTLIVSRDIDIYAVSAIGVLYPLVTVYFAFSQLVAIGAASFISRKLGEGKEDEVLPASITAFLMTLIISGILMALTWVFQQQILNFLGADDEVLDFALSYLPVLIISVPFTALVLLFSATFRSFGKMKLAMAVILSEASFIVLFNFIFISLMGGGIAWVGWSFVLAGVLTSVLGLIMFYKVASKSIKFTRSMFKVKQDAVKGILSVGVSALARSLAIAAFSLLLNRAINATGDEAALAALGTVNRMAMFLVFTIMGVNQAMQPIVSFNYTAGKTERVKQALKYALLYATAIGAIGTFMGFFIPRQVAQIFTTNAEVMDDVTIVFKMQMALFFTLGIQSLAATYFQAIGKAVTSLIVSILKQMVIMLPLIYLLPTFLGNDVMSIWWAYPLSDGIFTVVCILLLIKGVKQLEGASKKNNKLAT